MRKVLVIVILYFILNPSIFAQSLNFGLKGSVNASYLRGDYIYESEELNLNLGPKLSGRFSIGGFVRYNLTGMTSIQSEILYSTRGGHFTENIEFRNQDLKIDGDLTLSYIEIPLLIRLSTSLPDRGPTFVQDPGFTFNVYAGGSFAYKTNAKFSGRLSGEVLGDDFRERFENRVWNQFKGTDYSFIVGVGFEYGVKYRFTFDLRYVMSLTDIGNDPRFPDDIRNGMISVFIGTVI
jgi:hypothetical protein